jgi:hypothetical protein
MILATHGIIGSSITQFVGLLDTYIDAAAAYSLRKLRAAYTGSAIRVRRASDNTEQNIGFTALGGLDTSSLTSFCGSGNGFVTTWYDQSGNGYDATQTTAANQPQIVSSGSVILENGKPSVQFDGINDYLSLNSAASVFSGNNLPLSRIHVIRPTLSQASSFFSFGNSSNNQPLKQLELNASNGYTTYYRSDTSVIKGYSYGIQLINQQLLDEYNTGTISNVFRNSANQALNSDVNIGQCTLDRATLGALVRNTISSYYNGKIQETILYPSDQSSNRTGIESNINSFYSIY